MTLLRDLLEAKSAWEDQDELPEKTTAGELAARARRKAELQGGEHRVTLYDIPRHEMGPASRIIVLEGEGVTQLAALLGVTTGWRLAPVGGGFAACDGVRLTFFKNRNDYDAEGSFDPGEELDDEA